MPPKTDFCRLRECVRDEITSSLHDGGGRARDIARSVCAKHRDLISMLGERLAEDAVTDAAIELDGSTHQTFWGTWQTIPPLLRQSINTTVALFGREGDGSTVVELVDWFTLDIRGVDLTSAARLLPRQVTPSEIADPSETELRSFSPKDIADIVAAVLAS